jgi:hypothetical protein
VTHYSSSSISATSFLLGTREVRVQTRRPVIMTPSIIVTLISIGTSWQIRGRVPQNRLRPSSCNIPPIRNSLPSIIRCYIIRGTHSILRPRQRWKFPVGATMAQRGVHSKLPSALDRGKWSDSRPCCFTSGKEPMISISNVAQWVPESVWTFCSREKSIACAGLRNPRPFSP